MRPHDLQGRTFGLLSVVGLAPTRSQKGRRLWQCRCACGGIKDTQAADLISHRVRSCGCLRADTINGRASRHGLSGSRLYSIWRAMRGRCERPLYRGFAHYGGRGIQVCPEWRDFCAFATWAAHSGYEDSLTIDRKDCDGDYSPTNCRWATHLEQQRNKRVALKMTPALVREIRRLARDGQSTRKVAREVGVSKSYVHGILAGRRWADVSDEASAA